MVSHPVSQANWEVNQRAHDADKAQSIFNAQTVILKQTGSGHSAQAVHRSVWQCGQSEWKSPGLIADRVLTGNGAAAPEFPPCQSGTLPSVFEDDDDSGPSASVAKPQSPRFQGRQDKRKQQANGARLASGHFVYDLERLDDNHQRKAGT
ncbi:hypothetical protein PCASD_24378 [Puccinia coronata f. sp. avenae]|uniref:Uncharacterized protein n=1 Tax=Puccinia coronata f. sp. avenae TaxID=200324 RepID=A0A2N5S3J0_9BASI|nr:hypothetical protein PCASD_24378 [Puccinia coronata f. sp. avenae]